MNSRQIGIVQVSDRKIRLIKQPQQLTGLAHFQACRPEIIYLFFAQDPIDTFCV